MKKWLLLEIVPKSWLEYKNHTLVMTKRAKINALFMTKTAEKPYPLGPHGSIPGACGVVCIPSSNTLLFVMIRMTMMMMRTHAITLRYSPTIILTPSNVE